MATKKFHVLFLEDNVVSSTVILATLSKELPEVQFVQALNIAEATQHIQKRAFDLYILDIQLPDGNGIDFLCEVQKLHPVSSAIFMTATPLPEYRRKAEQLGAIRFFEKPLKIRFFSKVVFDLLLTRPQPQAESYFKGTLSCLTPMDLVQLKCLSRSNMGLKFSVPEGGSGFIYFRDGEVIHAETGSLKGEEAFCQIMCWKRGEVSETQLANHTTSITSSWSGLLIKAAQLVDEQEAKATA